MIAGYPRRLPRTAILLLFAFVCSASNGAFQAGSLPNPHLTPGDTLAVTVQDICIPGYTKLVRQVPAAVKQQVYAAYGRRPRKSVCCEVDHLISLELGGSNRAANLWPEPYDILWNARVKDKLENRLHKMVCAGELALPTAQKAIAKDWIAAYQRYEGAEPTTAEKRKRRRR
ncbi:MAG: hypothetical protein JWQ87_3092 [Candidatus Sulfotelmatobacter sp.]|nr:hypothetical protein [Candidatus Sulfotelmatobacter sp.]